MPAHCRNCGYDVEPDTPREMCPRCGDDGYSDWQAHQPTPRRERPALDDDGQSDVRELMRDYARR